MTVERLLAWLLGAGLLWAGAELGYLWPVVLLLVFGVGFNQVVAFMQRHNAGDFTAWQVIFGFLVIDVTFGLVYAWQAAGVLLLLEGAAGLALTVGSWERRRR